MNRVTGIVAMMVCWLGMCWVTPVTAFQRGIYISQKTVENGPKFQRLVARASAAGINTLVVDYARSSQRYHQNIKWIDHYGMKHVARIVVFPGGGTRDQVRSPMYWEKKYRLVEGAVAAGADEIQLDYIRYAVGQPSGRENVRDVHRVIQYFNDRIKREYQLPLQIDVFGVVSHGPSWRIGQHLPTFAESVDVVCPMVYPSHYEPYLEHAKDPYGTIAQSMAKLKRQFREGVPFKTIPYIEIYNYRYPMSYEERIAYGAAQMRAVRDANMQGWYVWSANNQYNVLFDLMKRHPEL